MILEHRRIDDSIATLLPALVQPGIELYDVLCIYVCPLRHFPKFRQPVQQGAVLFLRTKGNCQHLDLFLHPLEEQRIVRHRLVDSPHVALDSLRADGFPLKDAVVRTGVHLLVDHTQPFIQRVRVRAIHHHTSLPLPLTYTHTRTYVICMSRYGHTNLNRPVPVLLCSFLPIKYNFGRYHILSLLFCFTSVLPFCLFG